MSYHSYADWEQDVSSFIKGDTQIIRLLLTVIPDQRDIKIQEERVSYSTVPLDLFNDIP